MEIILIRHGLTEGNKSRRYVGRTDERLCPIGIESLKDKKMPAVHALIVSPMRRCLETAKILYPNMEYTICDGLKEIDFGLFEYRTYEELKDDKHYQKWLQSGGTLPFPEGEDKEGFIKRCQIGFDETIQSEIERGSKSICFVVHGGTIMAVMDRFSYPNREYFSWQIDNSCGYITEINETLWMAGDKKILLRGSI